MSPRTEMVIALISSIVALFWLISSRFDWEPILACLSCFGLILHAKSRISARLKIPTVEPEKIPPEQASQFGLANSAVFTSNRIHDAFPGSSDIEWFYGKEAVNRLSVLLRPPLVFDDMEPIWWFRFGCNAIDYYSRRGDVVRINDMEMVVSKAAVVPSETYYREFVYVETASRRPIRNIPTCEDGVMQAYGIVKSHGLFKRERIISLEEYFDGAYVHRSKPVLINENEAERRRRVVLRHNLLIAAKGSSINVADQRYLKSVMDKMIEDSSHIRVLREYIQTLPKHPNIDKI